jgi:hypothetical protein
MSGRKAERTDYVYIVVAGDRLGPEEAAFRTLKSARAHAAFQLSNPTTTKIDGDTWVVRSSVIPTCLSVIGRLPLRN